LNQNVPIILIIEDDESIQSLVEDALGEGGFESAIAPSGEEAVTLLNGMKSTYRALVTDIRLRGKIDGWEVAQRAREIEPEFPIVYMSGASASDWPFGKPHFRNEPEALLAIYSSSSSAGKHSKQARVVRAAMLMGCASEAGGCWLGTSARCQLARALKHFST